MIKILAISGSLRDGSYNTKTVRALEKLVPPGVDLKTTTLSAVPLFSEDLESDIPVGVTELVELVHWADGLIISTPEYSHHVSGVLVNTLNWLSRTSVEKPLIGKPVAIVGATTGGFGTVRSQDHLQLHLHVIGAVVPHRMNVQISNAREKFDEEGNLVDKDVEDRLRNLLKVFTEHIKTQKV